jgi:hypothetical protein
LISNFKSEKDWKSLLLKRKNVKTRREAAKMREERGTKKLCSTRSSLSSRKTSIKKWSKKKRKNRGENTAANLTESTKAAENTTEGPPQASTTANTKKRKAEEEDTPAPSRINLTRKENPPQRSPEAENVTLRRVPPL